MSWTIRGILAIAALTAFGHAAAQPYPSKPIRMIVPFPAGGITDLVARAVGDKISRSLGQPVIVENKPGAGSNLGVDFVARSKPDGYTIVAGTTAMAANVILNKSTPYDPRVDLAPITQIHMSPNVIYVNPELPIRDIREFVAYVKSKPGALSFGSPSIGSAQHMAGAAFFKRNGMEITHVPYKGSAQLIQDFLAGVVPIVIDTPSIQAPHVKSGKSRPIAVLGPKRSAALPDVPSVAEGGFSPADIPAWMGFFAPAGTPREVIERLSTEIRKAANDPEVRGRIESAYAQVVAEGPDALGAWVRSQIQFLDGVVKETGIKTE